MATINLAVTVPDGQVARMRAGLRAHFGQVSDGAGGMRDLTNAELEERIRQMIVHNIKDIVKRVEREAALATAEAGVTEIGAT